jgi:hypothetical protein
MDPRVLSLLFLGLAIPTTVGGPTDCLKPPFRGITERDAFGAVVGHVDPRDWNCPGSRHGGPTPQSASDVPPPMFDLCLHRAYPNPTDGAVRIEFSLTSTGNVRLTIYGQTQGHGRPEAIPVRVLTEATLVAGVFEVTWDLLDADGARVKPGIYRVVLEAQGQVFCGDIQVL